MLNSNIRLDQTAQRRNSPAAALPILVILIYLLIGTAFATNATAVYRSNTGACAVNALNCPKIREWNSTGAGSWGSEIVLATAGSPVREAVIKYSPISPKRVLVTQSDDGWLDAYVSFDGVTWDVTNDIGQVWAAAPGTHSRKFDVTFETTTGNAVVIYSVVNANAACDLAYKVLPANESNFSGITEQCINDAAQANDAQYTWVSIKRKPTAGSNELVAIGFNGSIANAWVWGGSGWGNQRTLLTASSTGGYEAIDVEYAADGSKCMAVSGSGTTGNVATFYWSAGAWTDSADFDVNASNNNDVQWIHLSSDPATDDIQAVYVDSGSDLGTAYWSGAAWTVATQSDAAIDIITTRPFDFAWDPSGSTGKLVWDTDGAGTTLSNRTCSPQCTGAAGTGSTYAGTGRWITLYTDPTAADAINMLGTRMNDANALGSFSWSGTVYANYGDTALSTATSANTYEGSGLDFQRAFDTAAPTYANQAQSANSIAIGGTVYLTADWTDNVRLKGAVLETNETGVFLNKSGVYGSPASLRGNFSPVNFTWSNASLPAGTNVSWRIWANDTSGNWAATPYMSFVIRLYSFTVSPTLDNFSVVNNTYIDRNYTMTNTGNQVLSISCSSNTSWATNRTSCPVGLGVGSQTNITYRFNVTGQPAGNPQVLLTFTDPNAGSKTATANVTITTAPVYAFTVSPTLDNFSVVNNTYIDRNYTMTNTGNQPLNISCSTNSSTFPAPYVNTTINISEGATGTASCSAGGTISSYVSWYGTNCAGGGVSCGTCTIGATSCSVTFNNANCGDPCVGTFKYSDLNITCSGVPLVSSITGCPLTLSLGASQNVTFRFNATGWPTGNPQVLLTFTDPNAGSKTAIANITIPDTTSPVINSISDYPDPLPQGNDITITANITDDIGVSSSNVEISGINYTMTKNGSTTIWYYVHNTSSLSSGLHSYTVYANDTSGNDAIPQTGSFTVSIVLYPSISTDFGSYSSCSIVYYKASVFDMNDQPTDASITGYLLDPSNTTQQQTSSITGNGGAGVYLGSFALFQIYSPGAWLLKVLSEPVKGQKSFNVTG